MRVEALQDVGEMRQVLNANLCRYAFHQVGGSGFFQAAVSKTKGLG